MSHCDSHPHIPQRLYHFMTLPTSGIYFGTKKEKVASEKKKGRICMKMRFLNVLWSPCIWAAFCSALIDLFSILWWTRKGRWGDLFETEVLTKVITFPDTLSLWEKVAKLEHQTCRLSIHWGLGLWRAGYILGSPCGSRSLNGHWGSSVTGKRFKYCQFPFKKVEKVVQCILSRFSTKLVKLITVHWPTS